LSYEAQAILIPGKLGRVPKRELAELFRDLLAEELKGKVKETTDVEVGALSGIESVIESRGSSTRVRLFATVLGVYLVQVTGSSDQIAGSEAVTFMAAFRPFDVTSPIASPVAAPGNQPAIYGGVNDPVFTDMVPEGGWLIGFEVG